MDLKFDKAEMALKLQATEYERRLLLAEKETEKLNSRIRVLERIGYALVTVVGIIELWYNHSR